MTSKQIRMKINGKKFLMYEGISILDACEEVGIKIPSLCYLEGVSKRASCGICMVEIAGANTLMRACVTPIREGIEIFTNTERVRKARQTNIKLLLANHPRNCLECDKNLRCELQKMADDLGVKDIEYPNIKNQEQPLDLSSNSIVRDPEKCILCARCVEVCSRVQGVAAIDIAERGIDAHVATFFNKGLSESECVNCGQCLLVCPTGALMVKSEVDKVWEALDDPDSYVVVQTAPAVRAAIGEEFGIEPGEPLTGKLTAAIRRLNFDKVFDTQFTADLTIVEEGNELLARIQEGGQLPLITSCSPGWISFAETFFPEVIPYLSSCKSPQQMFGALAKTYYAEKESISPEKIKVVSVMPCTAKKHEARRPEMNSAAEYWKKRGRKNSELPSRDVDYVLTTSELADMFREAGIDFNKLAGEKFDLPLGISTGAGTIFGATGGVMEAALRTVYAVLTGESLKDLNLMSVRGMEGIREAEIEIDGRKIKAAVAHGLKNGRQLMEEVSAGNSPYHFIEIMACPGGCIGGGGQPAPADEKILKKRAEALYKEDESKEIRESHKNPAIIELYKEYLEKPLGEISHELLHTHYSKREDYR
ncbi:MAG: 4Fe-4S binding protein [Elusimicrobia bacterium]|nr:4Fe-4S binding protein [Elusimicrobiota bacterium]